MHRNAQRLLTAATLCGTLGVGAAAATASPSPRSTPPTHGTVHVWVTPSNGAVEQILFTGVIGDHGTATSIDKDGTVDNNGQYVKIALAHGSFEVNAVALNRKLNKLQPTFDRASCSAWGTGGGNVTLFDGAGAYAGISGTVKITTSFAAILPRFTSGPKKGQCNANANAAPVAQFQGALEGSGDVSF
jgi:hypothetical protein